MTKDGFKTLLEQLPESIEKVSECLEDEEVVMIDFMDGERVIHLETKDDMYVMFDRDGCDIDTVNLRHILRNSVYFGSE